MKKKRKIRSDKGTKAPYDPIKDNPKKLWYVHISNEGIDSGELVKHPKTGDYYSKGNLFFMAEDINKEETWYKDFNLFLSKQEAEFFEKGALTMLAKQQMFLSNQINFSKNEND